MLKKVLKVLIENSYKDQDKLVFVILQMCQKDK
jgi:hypothetical protein